MKKVEHRGYTVVQHYNNHVMIFKKGGKMVYHAQCAKEKSEAELREEVDMYIDIFSK